MKNVYLKHKYRNKRCEHDGWNFASKKEGDYYLYLREEQKAGNVLFFLMQTPIHLPGNIKYICDFLVFYTDGDIEFIDVKGFETEKFKLKKRLVEATYPFDLKVVKTW